MEAGTVLESGTSTSPVLSLIAPVEALRLENLSVLNLTTKLSKSKEGSGLQLGNPSH